MLRRETQTLWVFASRKSNESVLAERLDNRREVVAEAQAG